METGGLFFKTALNQMFAGLYIEHLCLIGLFFLARDEGNGFAAIPEAALMIVLLISCIAAQIWLNCKSCPHRLFENESRSADPAYV